jgi:2-polyprenyl-3-methyl-5-hydroxy-6-metoxy-1,4-benzoquinol methylase
MAQIYTWDKEGFENAYWKYYYKIRGCGASRAHNCKCNDTYISYSRNFFETNEMFKERAVKVVNQLALPAGSKVLVVGAALGYVMEELQKLGMEPYGIDNSQYIKSIKNKEKVKFDIDDIDITANNFKTEINRLVGVTEFDCIITEDVLPSHDSWTKIFTNCEAVLKTGLNKNRIVHIVEVNAGGTLTSKTLAQWKALKTDHTWLDQNGNTE